MISRLAVAVFLVCSAAPCAAQDKALEDTLVALEKQSWVAWQNRDGDFFQHFLSDDHVELGAGGPSGKSFVVKSVASKACVVASYSVDHFTLTRFDENTALLTYRAEQQTKCGTAMVPSPAWTASLYVKRGGRWQNAVYQQSVIQKQ
jgi:hypothetical protein